MSDLDPPPLAAEEPSDADEDQPQTPPDSAEMPDAPEALRIEPERAPVYADRLEPAPVDAAPSLKGLAAAYQPADLDAWKARLDPDRFNDLDYRPTLRQLVEDVLAAEAPMYDDVLIRRVARAHGFARSGGRIKEAVLNAIPTDFARTAEDDRLVVWPRGRPPADVIGFRPAPAGVRGHAEVPLCELAGLARHIRETSWGGDLIRLIAARFELTRVEASTRTRFEQALARAQGAPPVGESF